VSIQGATLYVVATPIGNLADGSERMREVLGAVGVIAAEDTRHTGALLTHLGLKARLLSLNEQNEAQRVATLLERLGAGESVALVSDAGTPLISDPGYRLVRAAHDARFRVVPVPGASAVMAALSVAGLPTDRFCFEGFLPAKAAARRARLGDLRDEPRTLVFLESSHRLVESLADMRDVLGETREATLARELTKLYETVRLDTLGVLARWVAEDEAQRRGEMVVVVNGAAHGLRSTDERLVDEALEALLEALPLKQAVRVAGRFLPLSRNELYARALSLRGGEPE
jgi:16S rRNA (cytidine1402-2'-O)-methyltransferase